MSRRAGKESRPDASELNHEAYGKGCSHYEKGNYKRAKLAFESSLEYWPEDPQAWFALGVCFDALKKPTRAEECFRNALMYSQEEKKPDVYYNLGNSLYDQDRFAEAIGFYEKVTAQSTPYWMAQRNLARAKSKLSNS